MTSRAAVGHGLVLLTVSFCLWTACWALLTLLTEMGELERLVGRWRWPILVSVAVGTALGAVTHFSYVRRWFDRPCRWHEVRLAFYCLTLGWLTSLLVGRPEYRLAEVGMALGLSATLFFLFMLVGRLRSRRSRVLAGADLVLFNVCLLLVGTEVALRATAELRPSILLSRAYDRAKVRVAIKDIYANEIHLGFRMNSTGHYDSEFERRDDGVAVLVIGDSFSNSSVPHYYHYTTVAERELGDVEIYNMGFGRWGFPEYLYALRQEGLELEPDAIVIAAYLGNDLIPSWTDRRGDDEARGPVWLRSWFDPENVLIHLVAERLEILRVERDSLLGEGPGQLVIDPHPVIASGPDEIARVFPWVPDYRLEPPGLTEERFMQVETSRLTQISRQSREEYEEFLVVVDDLVRAAGEIPIYFLLIPDEHEIEDRLWQSIEAQQGRQLRRHRARRMLIERLEERGVEYLDLYRPLRSVRPEPDGYRHVYHWRETHLNTRGNRIAGEALAEFLEPRLTGRGGGSAPIDGRPTP